MNCLRLLRLGERHTFNLMKIPPPKCISSYRSPRFMETQDMWRERDGVSKRWQLIYKAPMDKELNLITTYLTFSTATVSLGGLYYAGFVFNSEDLKKPVIIGDDIVIANTPYECLIYLGVFVALHIAVKALLSKYVIRLYQDGDQYIAVFRGHFYNRIKKHQFHLNDFKKLNPTFVVSWGDGRFNLGNKHAIILENYFKTPEHFNYLLHKNKENNPNDDD